MLFTALPNQRETLERASELLKERRFEEARYLLRRIDPDALARREQPLYHAASGVVSLSQGAVSEAVEHHRKAAELAFELGLPKAHPYAANLATALYRLRAPEEARRAGRELLSEIFRAFREERSPSATALNFVLASALALLGEPDAEQAAYRYLDALTHELADPERPEPLIAVWGLLALAEAHLRDPKSYDDHALAERWAGIAAEVAGEHGLQAAIAAAIEVHYLAAASAAKNPELPEALRGLHEQTSALVREAAREAVREHLTGEERERALHRLEGPEAPARPQA